MATIFLNILDDSGESRLQHIFACLLRVDEESCFVLFFLIAVICSYWADDASVMARLNLLLLRSRSLLVKALNLNPFRRFLHLCFIKGALSMYLIDADAGTVTILSVRTIRR